MSDAFERGWDLLKMPVIPGSLKQTHREYTWDHPKRKMGFGPNPVEEGDESESDHFWYEARHTEDPRRSKWPPIDVSIQNYTDAWESTRPREGREMALSGSMGELFAYRDRDGNYRVYDGSLLSQGEGETAANQIAGWNEEGPLFDGYDTRFGKDAAPGWNRPEETPKRMSRRMEMLEVLATILSHAHPDAKLFPYRGKTPVAPNPKLLGGDLE
tara:strand:+ start:56 stop:697 length:642 start_codon:yes stop_codon:yes gene_type:complete